MKLLSLSGKFSKAKTFYHGTSVSLLPSILKHGLVPKTKNWKSDETSFTQQSRVSFGGIYLSDNFMTAYSAATNGNFAGQRERLLVVCKIVPQSAIPDEDSITFSAKSPVGDHEHTLIRMYALCSLLRNNDSISKRERAQHLKQTFYTSTAKKPIAALYDEALANYKERLSVYAKKGGHLHPNYDKVVADLFFAALARQVAHLKAGRNRTPLLNKYATPNFAKLIYKTLSRLEASIDDKKTLEKINSYLSNASYNDPNSLLNIIVANDYDKITNIFSDLKANQTPELQTYFYRSLQLRVCFIISQGADNIKHHIQSIFQNYDPKVPTIENAEESYRKALARYIKICKSYASVMTDFSNNLVVPFVKYSGANRIICVFTITDNRIAIYYGDLPVETKLAIDERLGNHHVIERKTLLGSKDKAFGTLIVGEK